MISGKDNKYISFLTDVTKQVVPVGNARMAAMLVMKNYPISLGTNQRKSHPFQTKYRRNCESIFLHAEIDAIYKALKIHSKEELKKSTLYVCRTTRDGLKALAKPCEGCQKAIEEYGISRVVYTESPSEVVSVAKSV